MPHGFSRHGSVLRVSKRSDVIVVGSGPLGTIVARRLAEAGCRVLVLEQGPPITHPPGSHLKDEPRLQKDPDAYLAAVDAHIDYLNPDADEAGLPGAYSTAAVGGQGTLWTGNCPRATAGLRWNALTPAEWEAAYAAAESILGVRDDQFSASIRQQRVAAHLRPHLSWLGPLTCGSRRMHIMVASWVVGSGPSLRPGLPLSTPPSSRDLLSALLISQEHPHRIGDVGVRHR